MRIQYLGARVEAVSVVPSPSIAPSSGVRLLFVLMLVVGAAAQHSPLTPTSNTVVVMTQAPMRYSFIHIPFGVTVEFQHPAVWPVPFTPAVIVCDGDAIVHGTLSVYGGSLAAGVVSIGDGQRGWLCGSTYMFGQVQTGGRHAGLYGSALPFSLEGGSAGGELDEYAPGCFPFLQRHYGGAGGGTIALLAGGRIEVHGGVIADGYSTSTSGGSGGSILLRGAGGVVVHPGGRVTASVIPYPGLPAPPPQANGGPGYIRLDAWGAPPVVQGLVDPPALVLELPHLRTQSPPRLGTTWLLDVFAPESSPTFVAVSLLAGPGTATVFGPLGIDLATASAMALTVPQPGHDPFASLPLAVPNAPVLVGLQLWAQSFVLPPNLPPRLSNTVTAVVQ
jgi:hypothetical protein